MSDLNYEYKYWMPAVARWIKINCDSSISEDVSGMGIEDFVAIERALRQRTVNLGALKFVVESDCKSAIDLINSCDVLSYKLV